MDYEIFSGATIIYENQYFSQYKSVFSDAFFYQNYFQIKIFDRSIFLDIEKFAVKNITTSELLFKFPNNTRLSQEFLSFLKERNYSVGWFALFVCKCLNHNHSIELDAEICKVEKNNEDKYFQLKSIQESDLGSYFVSENRELYRNLNGAGIMFSFICIYKNRAIGLIDIIKHEDNLEIFNLFVLNEYRNKGIAKSLQYEAYKSFSKNIPIVAVVDMEDTPKNMYKKLGFKENYFWIECQRSIH